MDHRIIRMKTLNTVFDQFIRDDLEQARGEWSLDRVKILTSMLKMKLESRSEDIDQSMVVSSNQEEMNEDSILDEIKLAELKASNGNETTASLSKLAVAINKLNKYVTSLKEIASKSPFKLEKAPQNITVNIVPQTPLKNPQIQTLNSLTPRRRTPFKEDGTEIDELMKELFNHPSVNGYLDDLTMGLIGNLMDDGSSSHASTPADVSESSELDCTLTAGEHSLTTPKEVFRKPPIERLTPSATTSTIGSNPVKNLMSDLRTPEKRGDYSPFTSSPFVPCSSPCPEPIGESPIKIVIPDFNSLIASPVQEPSMMSAPRPVFIVQQTLPQQLQHQRHLQYQQPQMSQVMTIQAMDIPRKIAPKMPGSGIKLISPQKKRPRKVDPSEIKRAIKETKGSNKIDATKLTVSGQKRKSSAGSSGGGLKRFVKLNPGPGITNQSPEGRRLIIDEGKIIHQISHERSTGQFQAVNISTINTSQGGVVNVNELCNTETMDFLKALPKNSQKLDELLLSKVHNKNSKR